MRQAEMSRQILEAPLVTLLLDETSDIQIVSLLATVLRHIRDSQIQERLVGFTDVTSFRNSVDLFCHIQNVVSEFTLEFVCLYLKRKYDLTEYLKKKIPSLATTRWLFSIRLANLNEQHKISILENFGGSEEKGGNLKMTIRQRLGTRLSEEIKKGFPT